MNWRIVGAWVAVGFVVSLVAGWLWPRMYESQAIVMFHFTAWTLQKHPDIIRTELPRIFTGLQEFALSDEMLMRLAERHRLYVGTEATARIEMIRRDVA